MGIKSNLNKAAYSIGGMISGSTRTKAHVLANRSKYGLAATGTRTTKAAANTALKTAMEKRQMQVGKRAMIGGTALGTMGVVNSDASKKGYYNPMPAPKGSGRFA